MAEGSNALIGLLLAAGAGVGAYWYLTKDYPCVASLFGGRTSEMECNFRGLLGSGCRWNAATQTCEGGNPTYCQQKATETECTGDLNCQWCADQMTCIERSIPCTGANACSQYGSFCMYPNQVLCDSGNNSCKCMPYSGSPTGYKFILEQQSAYNCNHDISYLDCFDSVDPTATKGLCLETRGTQPALECYRASSEQGCACPCETPGLYCDTDYTNKCFRLAQGELMQLHPENVTKTRDANGYPVWTYKPSNTSPIAAPYDIPFAANKVQNIYIYFDYPPGCGIILGGAHVKVKFKEFYTMETWGNSTIWFMNCNDPVSEEGVHQFTISPIDTVEISLNIDISHPEQLEITQVTMEWFG